MGRDDWFRNKTWDSATEAHFHEKLRRARNKAQRLRVQAGCLVNTEPRAALALLDRYFALGDHFEMAQAFLDRAEAQLTLGSQDEALISLASAIEREREFPNFGTQAWTRFTLLVAERKLDQLYDKALQVLEERRLKCVFSVEAFRWHAAFALIADAQGLRDYAANSAAKALEFADVTDSGFQYHPGVGLVGEGYDELKHKLRRLIRS